MPTIKAIVRRGEKEEQGDYYCRERAQGSFARAVALPAAIVGLKVKATFTGGLLEPQLPKTEKTKRHKIRIV